MGLRVKTRNAMHTIPRHIVAQRHLSRQGEGRSNLATIKLFQTSHLSVKPTGTQESIVQNVSAVGGSNDNDACVALKPIHLCEQLVQCLLALIVATANSSSTRAADCINFIHENNAWGILLGLQTPQVTLHTSNAAGTLACNDSSTGTKHKNMCASKHLGTWTREAEKSNSPS